MQLISTQSPSHHLLVSLMNYAVDKDDQEFNKYGFAYVDISPLLDSMSTYRFNSKKGVERNEKKYFQLASEFILLESDYIFDKTHSEATGYKHIKLDSVSFLETKPTFEGMDTYKIAGGIYCSQNWFVIQCERIPDGLNFSTIIYRSARIPYEKLKL